MFRNDDPTAVATAPTDIAPTGSPPGFFTDGNPAGGIAGTIVPDWWLNQAQEEPLAILAAAGITPVKGTNNQVITALEQLFSTGKLLGFSLYAPAFGATSPFVIPAGQVIPAGARRSLIKAAAGGGSGGAGGASGGGGGGGGAAGGQVEGWIGPSNFAAYAPGAAITGSVGNGTQSGAAAAATTLFIGGTEVAGMAAGGNGALGGSATVAGSTSYGSATTAASGLQTYNGQSGGNGILTSALWIGGQGGATIFGSGGCQQNTAEAAGAAANGNGATGYGAGGGGGTGTGSNGLGAPGCVMIWHFS